MNEPQPTRVAVASDQAIYLRGLSALIMSYSDLQLVGQAQSAAEALQLCEISRPDLVLLDLNELPEQGRSCAQVMMEKWPATRIILLVDEPLKQFERADEYPLAVLARAVNEDEFRAALDQVRTQTDGQSPGVFLHTPAIDLQEESIELLEKEQKALSHRSEEIMARELVMAGKIQADILPEEAPVIAGWEVAAKLEPARETSGDFYDFIPMSDHKLGVVVADVTDKGMGAALFMALSSTLIRTYATRFPTLPALTLSAVSERILSDTRGSMFVTTFMGVLEPNTGRLVFANAGHPPGFLVSWSRGKASIEHLRPTGMALGVSETAQWKQKIVRMAPGDLLVLYTDGITEAQNQQGQFFEEDMILDVVLAKENCTAHEVQDALLEEVHRFVGHAPRQDDVALIVIRRKP